MAGNLYDLKDGFFVAAGTFFASSNRPVAENAIAAALGEGEVLSYRDASIAASAIYDAWRCDYFNEHPDKADELLSA